MPRILLIAIASCVGVIIVARLQFAARAPPVSPGRPGHTHAAPRAPRFRRSRDIRTVEVGVWLCCARSVRGVPARFASVAQMDRAGAF